MSITTEFIRNRVENQTYEISLHADDERLADALTISQLEFVLLNCEIIETYPDDPRGESCLALGFLGDETPVKLAENLYGDIKSKVTIRFSGELRRASRRKLLYLNDAEELRDLRTPPGNNLKQLKGEMKGYYSIRINDQWRVIFKWEDGNALDVKIVDYH